MGADPQVYPDKLNHARSLRSPALEDERQVKIRSRISLDGVNELPLVRQGPTVLYHFIQLARDRLKLPERPLVMKDCVVPPRAVR